MQSSYCLVLLLYNEDTRNLQLRMVKVLTTLMPSTSYCLKEVVNKTI